MHYMPYNMHNMQNVNMQNNMQINMQNMLVICRFGADCLVLTLICRICQIICSICIICYGDFQYAQYALPTLLMKMFRKWCRLMILYVHAYLIYPNVTFQGLIDALIFHLTRVWNSVLLLFLEIFYLWSILNFLLSNWVSICNLFWGWTFLHHPPLMGTAFVVEQMISLDIIDWIVLDGLDGHGHKEITWFWQPLALRIDVWAYLL